MAVANPHFLQHKRKARDVIHHVAFPMWMVKHTNQYDSLK